MWRNVSLSMMGLALAGGLPFAYYTVADYMKTPAEPAGVARQAPSSRPQMLAETDPADRITPPRVHPSLTALEHPPILDLGTALRFDVTQGWIRDCWPRVSTGLGQIQLEGFRVPLVTGTAEDDLAGSLSYYFDHTQQLQRIGFFGTTGDPQKLVAFLTSRYGFRPKIINDPAVQLYEVPRRDGTSESTLRVEAADIMKITEAYRRYRVSLVIDRSSYR